jgi:hypothetical protein
MQKNTGSSGAHLNVNGGPAFDENPEEAKVLPLSRPVQHSPPFSVLKNGF